DAAGFLVRDRPFLRAAAHRRGAAGGAAEGRHHHSGWRRRGDDPEGEDLRRGLCEAEESKGRGGPRPFDCGEYRGTLQAPALAIDSTLMALPSASPVTFTS